MVGSGLDSGIRLYLGAFRSPLQPWGVNPQIGGGYRRYSQLSVILGWSRPVKYSPYIDLEFPALSGELYLRQMWGHIDSYGMVRVANPYIQPRGLSPTRR
ncbi:hypothetical protein N39L_52310 [Limnospira platensis NIES-39]|nr:hypothetical protein N39L_52310 [Arthrospira platensis NIES-39]